MRTEFNAECPKCGYKFIEVGNGLPLTFTKEQTDEWFAEYNKLKLENKICIQHSLKFIDGKCRLCEEEKKLNAISKGTEEEI